MSKNTIFDITLMSCPLCRKEHKIDRVEFDEYHFRCPVYEKQFYIKMTNLKVQYGKIWVNWLNGVDID